MYIAYSREFQYKKVGNNRQLFIDDDVIACVRNVKRTQHIPRKHQANPLICRDKPWEVVPYLRTPTFNVVKDPEDGLFKCWYEDYYDYFGSKSENLLQGNRVYYAQSRDGLNWEKPELGKLQLGGHNTNTVFSYPPYEMASCNSVLFDPKEKDPGKRYKTVYVYRTPNANRPKKTPMRSANTSGLHMAFSPDGIDWTPSPDNPIIPDWGCDVEILTYDPVDDKYVIFGRGDGKWYSTHPDMNQWFVPVWPGSVEGIWGTRRCVYRTESRDCYNWDELELIFDPGEEANLQDAYYGFVPWRIDEMHLGIMNILREVDNTVEMELYHSRDGRNWKRFSTRDTLMPLGPEGSYDCYMVETPTQPLIVGDEVWIYYGGGSVHHDWWIFGQEEGLDAPEVKDPTHAQNGHHLCLATLRRDGWVSLDATLREGYIETKPMFSPGAHLYINACCAKDGFIDVEIMDNWDNVWKGFGRKDCRTFRADCVHEKISWNGGDAVNMIPGIVKLKFYLKNAELYSFQFSDS